MMFPSNDESFLSFLPADSNVPCAISYMGRTGQGWAIFPVRSEAEEAAAIAARYDLGGFWDVELHRVDAAPADTPRFASAIDWFME